MNACGEMKIKRLILMGSGEEFGPVTGPFDDYTIAAPPSQEVRDVQRVQKI
jgi:hypothetical protein